MTIQLFIRPEPRVLGAHNGRALDAANTHAIPTLPTTESSCCYALRCGTERGSLEDIDFHYGVTSCGTAHRESTKVSHTLIRDHPFAAKSLHYKAGQLCNR